MIHRDSTTLKEDTSDTISILGELKNTTYKK